MSRAKPFKDSKIYKIVCKITDEVYYGSTNYSLSERLCSHRTQKNNKCSAKQIIDRGNYEMVLVENYPCENKNERDLREKYYIKNFPCINKVIPCRLYKEYYEDNKERILARKKAYYHNNLEKMREYQRGYQILYRQKKKQEKLNKEVV